MTKPEQHDSLKSYVKENVTRIIFSLAVPAYVNGTCILTNNKGKVNGRKRKKSKMIMITLIMIQIIITK